MVVKTFYRMEPVAGSEPAAVVGEPVLTSPGEFVTRLRLGDGIVVASWDFNDELGRVHALGIVSEVSKAASNVTVDWRRANFTVQPSPQGRTQWLDRKHFKFAEQPAKRYRLADHFHDAFAADATAIANPQSERLSPPAKDAAPERVAPSLAARRASASQPSPQRNRVAPDGTIFATTARGTFMGNRAYGDRWLVCELHFERDLKEPRKYEKLFFLDEAVALAAGHRPCVTCRRHRYQEYLSAVQASVSVGGAGELDAYLKHERAKPPVAARVDSLPNGAFVSFGDAHWLVWNDALHRWTPAGYADEVARPDLEGDFVAVLTPATSVAALANGYKLAVHGSVRGG